MECDDRKKTLNTAMPVQLSDLSAEIKSCFQWTNHTFTVECYDKEFKDFVELGDQVDIPDKTRVRVRLKSSSGSAPASPAPVHSSPSKSISPGKFISKVSSADINQGVALEELHRDSEEFFNVEELLKANMNNHIDDYVKRRIEKSLKPIAFRLKSAQRVVNLTLTSQFEKKKEVRD